MAAIAMACSSRIMALRLAVKPHGTLLHNVSSVAGGSLASSVLGFAYWIIAARCFSLEPVGLTAAAVSLMGLIALVAQLGLGTLLMGPVRESEERYGLISAALAISFAVGIMLGCLFIAVAGYLSLGLGGITGSSPGALLFVLGCGLTSVALTLNNAFVGLLRSSLQLYQTVAFSLTKLIFLAALALRYGSEVHEAAIFATWVAAQLVCSGVFVVLLKKANRGIVPVPRFRSLFPLMPAAISHHLLDLVIQAPLLSMPFLVAVVISPSANAAFNAAWMTLRTAFLPAEAISMVLFAIGKAGLKEYTVRIRFSVFVLAGASAAAVLLFACFSNQILSLFNPQYGGIAAGSLRILGLSVVGAAIKAFYLAIQRIDLRMIYASRIFAAGGCIELLFALAGGYYGGLLGLSAGWTAAMLLQAVLMGPTVLRAAGLNYKPGKFAQRLQLQG